MQFVPDHIPVLFYDSQHAYSLLCRLQSETGLARTARDPFRESFVRRPSALYCGQAGTRSAAHDNKALFRYREDCVFLFCSEDRVVYVVVVRKIYLP